MPTVVEHEAGAQPLKSLGAFGNVRPCNDLMALLSRDGSVELRLNERMTFDIAGGRQLSVGHTGGQQECLVLSEAKPLNPGIHQITEKLFAEVVNTPDGGRLIIHETKSNEDSTEPEKSSWIPFRRVYQRRSNEMIVEDARSALEKLEKQEVVHQSGWKSLQRCLLNGMMEAKEIDRSIDLLSAHLYGGQGVNVWESQYTLIKVASEANDAKLRIRAKEKLDFGLRHQISRGDLPTQSLLNTCRQMIAGLYGGRKEQVLCSDLIIRYVGWELSDYESMMNDAVNTVAAYCPDEGLRSRAFEKIKKETYMSEIDFRGFERMAFLALNARYVDTKLLALDSLSSGTKDSTQIDISPSGQTSMEVAEYWQGYVYAIGPDSIRQHLSQSAPKKDGRGHHFEFGMCSGAAEALVPRRRHPYSPQGIKYSIKWVRDILQKNGLAEEQTFEDMLQEISKTHNSLSDEKRNYLSTKLQLLAAMSRPEQDGAKCYHNTKFLIGLSSLYLGDVTEMKAFARTHMKAITDKAGLDFDELVDVWKRNWQKHPEISVGRSLDVLNSMNEENPEMARQLREKYGIEVFGRYTPHTLKSIFEDDKMGVTPPHSGLIVMPKDDWNGAFFQNAAIWQKMVCGLHTRIAEAGSKIQIARSIINHSRQVGPIEYLIIGGHGSPRSIQMGAMDLAEDQTRSRSQILIDDFQKKGVNRLFKDYFIPEPTIIAVSCSTGADLERSPVSSNSNDHHDARGSSDTIPFSGIGQVGSSASGGTVFAPNMPTSLKLIDWELAGDRLSFQVSFDQEYARRQFTAGKKQQVI